VQVKAIAFISGFSNSHYWLTADEIAMAPFEEQVVTVKGDNCILPSKGAALGQFRQA
jgi:hypothetical protein